MDEEIARQLIASLEIANMRYQQREASAWLVLCWDEDPEIGSGFEIVGTYGPFATPEEALVQCGKHDACSEFGFKNEVVPLYPPVDWKDGS